MKNLLLTVLLVFSFTIALLLAGAPQRGKFVVEVNTTLMQLAQDLPAPTSMPTKRTEHSENKSSMDSLLASALADCVLVSNGGSTKTIAASEPDCGGWND